MSRRERERQKEKGRERDWKTEDANFKARGSHDKIQNKIMET
jgi:hypothetical protein